MVLVNSNQRVYNDLKFRYFLEVPRCDVVFGSARETTGKAHLFLIFKSQDKIYRRNGKNQTWEELRSSESVELRPVLVQAISDHQIPRYTTQSAVA